MIQGFDQDVRVATACTSDVAQMFERNMTYMFVSLQLPPLQIFASDIREMSKMQ